jgi:hypothetical protein
MKAHSAENVARSAPDGIHDEHFAQRGHARARGELT